jgi:hypothetical protein
MNAPTQQAKKDTCDHIVKMIRGRFLRLDVDRSCWVEIDDETARTKVAQAFQYRQRRHIQKDPPDGPSDDSPKKDRKRKLSTASFLPDHSNPAMYQSMRIPQPFELDSTTVTLDELRWVLGSQSSLPQHQPPQQQQHWQQQQPQPHQHLFHQSTSGQNTLSCDSLVYSEDYAIGMPATMRSRQDEQIQQLVQPINEMNSYVERMRHNAMPLGSTAMHSHSTANFPMQSRCQPQANLLQFQEDSRIASSAQQLQSQQPSLQYQHLNWQQSQPDCTFMSTAAHNPISDAVASTMYSSQSLDPNVLQQSFHSQSGSSASNTNVILDNFGNVSAPTDVANSLFDFSRLMTPSSNFQVGGSGQSYESGNTETQRRTMLPNMEHNVYPILQQPLLIDPLPLDENEVAPPYDKVMGRLDRSNGD